MRWSRARRRPAVRLDATGWLFAPFPGDWQLDDRDIRGGPDVGLTGPFIRLALGAGS